MHVDCRFKLKTNLIVIVNFISKKISSMCSKINSFFPLQVYYYRNLLKLFFLKIINLCIELIFLNNKGVRLQKLF